jgi:hypothetical protein
LDRIVVAQLRGLLAATTLPTLAPQDRDTPYAPLPALEHLAIYTLNLVLLRAYLCDGSYVLNESSFGDQAAGARPWDRLTALWRSWFAPESLAALASRMTATRTLSGIVIVPAQSPLAMTSQTTLATAYNASLALADDLTTASLGLHLASLTSVPETFIEDLRERVKSETPGLVPVIDFAVARTTRQPLKDLKELPISSAEQGQALGVRFIFDSTYGYLPPGLAVEYAEIVDRLCHSPASRASLKTGPSNLDEFASLSRYAAEVAVSSRITAEPRWLPDLVMRLESQAEEWRRLLSCPAAAPFLRAALRQLAGHLAPTQVAKWIEDALAERVDILFDIDTAAVVAILAWQGECATLCSRVLDYILLAVRQGAWHLSDIHAEVWSDLADLFASALPEAADRLPEFAELLSREKYLFRGFTIADHAEIRVNAIRIGIPGDHETMGGLLGELSLVWTWDCGYSRRLFLLLVRYAREHSDLVAVADLFLRGDSAGHPIWKRVLSVPPDQDLESVDIDAICMPLTYREAMDLRWALDIARQELPNQGTKSQPSTPPRRPRKR